MPSLKGLRKPTSEMATEHTLTLSGLPETPGWSNLKLRAQYKCHWLCTGAGPALLRFVGSQAPKFLPIQPDLLSPVTSEGPV